MLFRSRIVVAPLCLLEKQSPALCWEIHRQYITNPLSLIHILEELIAAAAAPYRSKRIHIGMDEAHGIGLGAHRRRHGYEDPHTIILSLIHICLCGGP